MKLFVFVAILAVAAAAPQFGNFGLGKGATFKKVTTVETTHSALPVQAHFVAEKSLLHEDATHAALLHHQAAHAAHAALTREATAAILEHDYQMSEPGRYVYRYKTDNGIEIAEEAALKGEGEAKQGSYSWTAPNGEKYTVEWVADETGYHARGAHIPEIPVAIARSLEYIAAHPDPEAHKYDN